jgi:hypothetical protein
MTVIRHTLANSASRGPPRTMLGGLYGRHFRKLGDTKQNSVLLAAMRMEHRGRSLTSKVATMTCLPTFSIIFRIINVTTGILPAFFSAACAEAYCTSLCSSRQL